MSLAQQWLLQHTDEIVSLAELEHFLLAQRGLTTSAEQQAFFSPDYKRDIHDPLQLYSMEQAVNRIFSARDKQEKVLIYGDYDADGITGAAILVTTLRQLGLVVTPFLPDRHTHGYGLHQPVLAEIADDVSLLITVDCGITAVDEVAWLQAQGIDTIIVDHHSVPKKLPRSVAIIHPAHPQGDYPNPNLCGAGTAWKLASALLTDQRSPVYQDPDAPKWLLDLAAVGTIADMVPLQGENRCIVRFGLEIMRRTERPGMRELVRGAVKESSDLTSEDVSWNIISKLNAAGRIDHAQPALDLILAEDRTKATEFLTRLSSLNRQRQTVTKKITQEAEEQIDESGGIIFAYSPEWPAGVVGLVANALARKFARPSFIVGTAGKHAVGSVRSPKTHNALQLLTLGEDILLKFGGHKQAAGFTLNPEKISHLAERLRSAAEDTTEKTSESAVADCALAPELISLELVQWLKRFEPFGEGNQPPQFLFRGLVAVEARPVGKTQEHVKYLFRAGNEPVEGIGFGLAQADSDNYLRQKVDVIARPEENNFRGRRRLQLTVKAIAPTGTTTVS